MGKLHVTMLCHAEDAGQADEREREWSEWTPASLDLPERLLAR